MTNVSGGPGWWQASDGRWYPPTATPGPPPPPAPPPSGPGWPRPPGSTQAPPGWGPPGWGPPGWGPPGWGPSQGWGPEPPPWPPPPGPGPGVWPSPWPRRRERPGLGLVAIVRTRAALMVLAVAAGILALGEVLVGAGTVIYSFANATTSRDLVTAGGWMFFSGTAVALLAVGLVAWGLVVAQRWALVREIAGATLGTLLLAIGALVTAASPRSTAGDILWALGFGAWAVILLSVAARISMATRDPSPSRASRVDPLAGGGGRTGTRGRCRRPARSHEVRQHQRHRGRVPRRRRDGRARGVAPVVPGTPAPPVAGGPGRRGRTRRSGGPRDRQCRLRRRLVLRDVDVDGLPSHGHHRVVRRGRRVAGAGPGGVAAGRRGATLARLRPTGPPGTGRSLDAGECDVIHCTGRRSVNHRSRRAVPPVRRTDGTRRPLLLPLRELAGAARTVLTRAPTAGPCGAGSDP